MIPRRRQELTDTVAEAVSVQLLNHADFEAALSSESIKDAVKDAVEQYIKHAIWAKLRPLKAVSKLLSSVDQFNELPAVVSTQLAKLVPTIMPKVAEQLRRTMDIRAIVAERVGNFSDRELEELIFMVAERELGAIEYWGLVIGGVIGGLQWALLSLVAA